MNEFSSSRVADTVRICGADVVSGLLFSFDWKLSVSAKDVSGTWLLWLSAPDPTRASEAGNHKIPGLVAFATCTFGSEF